MTQHGPWGHAPLSALKPYARNARQHSEAQINKIADSIKRFGFTNPILIDEDHNIVAGHGRAAAAKKLGLEVVPVVRLAQMSEQDKRAYILADNRLAELAHWDKDHLASELEGLLAADFEIDVVGFEPAEIDLIIEEASAADVHASHDKEDNLPALVETATTRLGDAWLLGRHRLLCGDARDEFALASLLAGEQADALFTDPPYNVVIEGNVRKTGANRDFAMASGEMSEAEFRAWLLEALRPSAESCRDGAIAFICMDWRHMSDVLAAGAELFSELKNLCIWTKANGGQGSLYRSQHELIFVFKRGGAPHCNNVQLGKHGRNRTNIWRYAGVNGFRAGRSEELALHPTCKPVALVKDALMDVTRRNAIVLDCFGGSGSTLIAAHSCGRRARLLELDPLYCDVIVRRFERLTGKSATLQGSGETFEQICARRLKGGAE